MANPEENHFFDIFNFELQLRERINELQWKTETLEETQKELSETRRLLYETQNQLDDERRSSRQWEMQLKTALENTKQLEEEAIKSQTEQVREKMKFESASIERDVLLDQARTARLENMNLKVKLQEYERSLTNANKVNQTLERSLAEIKNKVTLLHNKIHSTVGKLEREQQQLRKSCDDAMKFGQRVQGILKNSHAVRQRDKRTIEDLRKRIDALDLSRQKSVPVGTQDADMGHLHLKIESCLKELQKKLESNRIDDRLSSICTELRKTDGRLTKD